MPEIRGGNDAEKGAVKGMSDIIETLDASWIVGGGPAIVVVICVLIHYEGLRFLSDKLLQFEDHHRRRIVVLILSLLALHIIEIWVFGFAYYFLLSFEELGALVGVDKVTIFDSIYFSATVYTTLGFGDITPQGPIRTLTGTEGITGLTIITWSASFAYLEMARTWNKDG